MIIDIEIPKEPGVYKVTNLINGDFYIGSAENLYKRLNDHNNAGNLKMFNSSKLKEAYVEFGSDNFRADIVKVTEDFFELEDKLIKTLNPAYNILKRATRSKTNIGKKFSQEWIDKLGKCEKHSDKTREKLIKLNKNGATKLKFVKGEEVLEFESSVEACSHFGINSATFKNKYKGYKVEILQTQKKKVELVLTDGTTETFNSSYDCDKFLNLWRGATSNAIRNKQGKLHECKVKYI